jgi:FMN-dependent NADH-azoreductase
MKLLHIIATPRIHNSNTLRISNAFIEGLFARYEDLDVEALDLFDIDLPSVTGDNIEAKYTLIAGAMVDKRHKESWKQIESLIKHFQNADMYLVSTPMWNFGVPYALKYYIDAIVQPNYLFRYNELGQPEGMVKGKKMVCITTRGGDYSKNSPFHMFDFLEPYLRAIFGWVGITDIEFINAQPMDITREMRQAAVEKAIVKAQKLAASVDWRIEEGEVDTVKPKGLKPAPLE